MTAEEIMKAVECGCRTFYFGGFGDFDELCHKIVTKIKNENPEIEIERKFCVPREQDLRKTGRYFKEGLYEDFIYLAPSFDGWYKSIYFRNCAMIDHSDIIIFYAESRKNSGAYKTYKYAKRKKDKQIINLWDD